MKPNTNRVNLTRPRIRSIRLLVTYRALLYAIVLSFVLGMNACNKNEAPQTGERGDSTTRQRDQSTSQEHSERSVKDLFLSGQRHSNAPVEQRRQLIEKLSTSELVTSIRSLNLLSDGNDRMILPSIFATLAEKDPNKMMDMLHELPGEYYKSAILKAFPYLARENPEFLQDYVLENDFTGEKNRWLMIGACEVLGKENPARALRFFDQMSDEKQRSHLGTVLLKQAATKTPELVVTFLTKNETAPYFASLFRDVLYTVLVTDPAFAREMALSYPEVDSTDLSAGIYTSMARQDPRWALEEMSRSSPTVRTEVFTRRSFDNKTYFSKLFSEDPTKTINLMNGIIPTTANLNLFKEAADRLSSLPAGAAKDSSVRSFADLIRATDPEAADRWMESIQ